MSLKKRVVFSDYDGTIYAGEDSIERNVEAIAAYREHDGIFVVVSGRSRESFGRVQKQYGVPYDYLIANNGSLVVKAGGEILEKVGIDRALAERILEFLRMHYPQAEIMYYDEAHDKTEYYGQELQKIRAYTGSDERAAEMERGINVALGGSVQAHAVFKPAYYPDVHDAFVDIVAAGAGKENAIARLLGRLGIAKEEATAIGDGGNDVEMLREYRGYAVEGAEERALVAAAEVRRDVAEVLEGLDR